MGWGGASRGPKGRGWGEKVFPVMRGGAGMGKDKIMRGGDEDPILRPRPAPLPSLLALASMSFAYTSGNQLRFGTQWICNCESHSLFSTAIKLWTKFEDKL